MSKVMIEIEADDLVALNDILKVPDGESVMTGNTSSVRIFRARKILGFSTQWPNYCLQVEELDWSKITRGEPKGCQEKSHGNDFYGSRFTFDVRSSAENMALELKKHCQRQDFSGWEILCLYPLEDFNHVDGGRHGAVNVIWKRKAE